MIIGYVEVCIHHCMLYDVCYPNSVVVLRRLIVKRLHERWTATYSGVRHQSWTVMQCLGENRSYLHRMWPTLAWSSQVLLRVMKRKYFLHAWRMNTLPQSFTYSWMALLQIRLSSWVGTTKTMYMKVSSIGNFMLSAPLGSTNIYMVNQP